MQKAGDAQDVIDLRVRADQFQVGGLVRLAAGSAHFFQVALGSEQLEDVLERTQAGAGEHIQL
ncbi:MAG: hypothetical protein M0C28_35035 [Candidatus Moduliflexus flocculans]|nr:hypothetical protein [Candidatus Moduliflexus flocculans]